jgi:hypothetical protein
MKISEHEMIRQLERTFGGKTFHEEVRPAFCELVDMQNVKLPFDPDSVFWIRNRIPIFSDVLAGFKRSSLLLQLGQNVGGMHLVMDSVRQQKQALFFAMLYDAHRAPSISQWTECMNPAFADMTLKSVGDELILLLVAARSFVPV